MDNLTHSLTGALTSRFIEARSSASDQKAGFRKIFFWLFVVAANIPDIDVLLGLFGDPILSIRYHRGLTHSILFAPVLAAFPALVFRFFSSVKNLRILWIVALLGVVLHIFFDLVTSFGTRILTPLSETRFALDWLFIIDPVLTVGLGCSIVLAWKMPGRRSSITSAGVIFVVLYVLLTAFSHGAALRSVQGAAKRDGLSWTRISALPQPLSPFRWQGLVQSEEGVHQCFFSVFDEEPVTFRLFRHDSDSLIVRTTAEPEVLWYLSFARHPLVRSFREGETQVVEYRDMTYSLDESLTRALGFTERSIPFQLRFFYDDRGNRLSVMFDGEVVP